MRLCGIGRRFLNEIGSSVNSLGRCCFCVAFRPLSVFTDTEGARVFSISLALSNIFSPPTLFISSAKWVRGYLRSSDPWNVLYTLNVELVKMPENRLLRSVTIRKIWRWLPHLRVPRGDGLHEEPRIVCRSLMQCICILTCVVPSSIYYISDGHVVR